MRINHRLITYVLSNPYIFKVIASNIIAMAEYKYPETFISSHCKNVRVLSGLSQLHKFKGFYNSPHNECFISVIKILPLIKIS